jgi:hypothetical protein
VTGKIALVIGSRCAQGASLSKFVTHPGCRNPILFQLFRRCYNLEGLCTCAVGWHGAPEWRALHGLAAPGYS